MANKIVINCPECSEKIRVPSGKHIKFTCPKCGKELEYYDRLETNKQHSQIDDDLSFGDRIINLLSWLIVIPIFIILHKLLPNPDWIFNIDRILIGISSIMIIRLILYLFKLVVLIAFGISFILLLYGSIWGSYGFGRIYKDYKAMIYTMINIPTPQFLPKNIKIISNSSEIKEAIEFDNPQVRNYALSATRKHFVDYQENGFREIIQYFAVFKEINSNWHYVSDPTSHEYFAKASETVMHLSGDCDDYSIFMAACIKAIGGTTRLVHTNGHLYPELLIGTKNNLEVANYIIKRELFVVESQGKEINYHTDDYGNIWLNLDYTEQYPGGNFMDKEILGVLVIY